jgi:NADPH:quinone reductase and related Zn-dependent oxidoreductases
VLKAFGGPENLVLEDVPEPVPGEGQVLVELTAIGVNFVEIYHRIGRYPGPLPRILGSEGAGRVVAVGPGVDSVRVGDRVASASLQGAYAQKAVAAATDVVPVPESVSDETAAAAFLQGLTAHYLLFDTYPVKPGDTVLVHAAAGGVGLLLTQIATRLGARVIATVSTEEKERLARGAGAAEVIRYGDGVDVAAEVRRLTNGEGVAAVYDGVGAATFDASLASLRPRGVLALFGQSSGPVPSIDPQRLNAAGSVFLTRPTLWHYVATPEELRRRADDLFRFIAEGLDIRIHDRYPLRDAGRAQSDLESRRTTGKLLLIP